MVMTHGIRVIQQCSLSTARIVVDSMDLEGDLIFPTSFADCFTLVFETQHVGGQRKFELLLQIVFSVWTDSL